MLSLGPEEVWDEEVAFLKKLYQNQLGISQRSAYILKQMIVLEEGEGYLWSGKTGGGDLPDGKAIGWLVGFLETKDNVWVYALNIEDESFEKMAPKRLAIAKKLFEGLGLIKGKDSSTQDSR
jgi:beta-lactamase class D